jgi:hypothetical protein
MKTTQTVIGLLAFIALNFELNAQHLTASFVDDLGENKSERTLVTFNKKVKLTHTENGKSVVVRINDRVNSTENNKVAILSKSAEESSSIKNSKGKIKIQEIEDDSDEIERFWATADNTVSANANVSPAFKSKTTSKEVEIETVKIEGYAVNHVYDLNGNKMETVGYGLQLAAFTQLQLAKDYADKIVKKGEAEANKIYIQVSKADDKPMIYRVLYGFFESEMGAKESQKKMANYGFDTLVKGFN